jgi:Uma2 family endonuclease
MTVAAKHITAEELAAMGDIGRCELIRGEIIHMAPSFSEHGDIAQQIAYRIEHHIHGRRLGRVYITDTGFLIARNPDTVRAPDVSFVRQERVPRRPARSFFPGPPDLAVEVVSSSDRRSEVLAKTRAWLAAGAISVWVVDPRHATIDVYHAADKVTHYSDDEELRDEAVLPGFVLKLGELFAAE